MKSTALGRKGNNPHSSLGTLKEENKRFPFSTDVNNDKKSFWRKQTTTTRKFKIKKEQ